MDDADFVLSRFTADEESLLKKKLRQPLNNSCTTLLKELTKVRVGNYKMPSQEQLQAIDDGLVRRAEHYLRLSEWLNQSDEEAVETWRQDVADCVQVAHDVFQCLDPQYETSTLKEVAYRQYNETSGAVVISKKSIMLWRIPGSLHSFSASYIGADGVLYVTPQRARCVSKSPPVKWK